MVKIAKKTGLKPTIGMYNIFGKQITLNDRLKAALVLERDGCRCRGCGSQSRLAIQQLIDQTKRISADILPRVVHALLCPECIKRFRIHQAGSLTLDPEEEMAFHEKLYHEGIYRAEQDLM